MRIHLKKGEKLYVNGAVLKADHRCSIELLNNVNFLLESHILRKEKAETPIKKIYFAVQEMLISPEHAKSARDSYWELSNALHSEAGTPVLLQGLSHSDICVKSSRYFNALKILRSLFEVESSLLKKKSQQ